MPLRVYDPTDEPSLNLTPMIDIVFLLIIFFMVGTQFTNKDQGVDVQLPTVSDLNPLTSLPDEIVVNVSGHGMVFIQEEQLTLAQLEANLRAAQNNYPDQKVIVRGSGPGPYQHVMDVLATCRRAKINHISLANRLEEKK
jgi:biopolymer transport protein ExbD